ncbi:uncharacterized protein LOC119464511 isoform X3 [Dermacentor silvarum]|uniref:uncharacterized protein LOC119464511 isoform X3 n=1 Tax=Dermacentor silvarum TaxID=543639 RepID=UPI0021006971|nr:uncharacterized protein LOC119464511 isoform X3 [Dermacentor silvarum]
MDTGKPKLKQQIAEIFFLSKLSICYEINLEQINSIIGTISFTLRSFQLFTFVDYMQKRSIKCVLWLCSFRCTAQKVVAGLSPFLLLDVATAPYLKRNLVERNSCYQENQANKDLMEAPQYQLLNRDGLGDRTPRRSQPERQKSQELPFENAGNAFAEGTVCHEEKMDHQETEEEHLVIREREAGDYFGDPTPRMSRLTTLLAAQSASKLLGKRTQRGLQDDQSPIAPKSAITTKSSGQDQLWDVSDQPALSDACRCWRPSTAQAQNDVLHNDWDDTLEPVMSKLVDLTIDQQCTKGCHVVPKYEQLHADAANVLEPVVRKLEDMQMNPWRAEMPTADTGDEHKDTDSPNPLQ